MEGSSLMCPVDSGPRLGGGRGAADCREIAGFVCPLGVGRDVDGERGPGGGDGVGRSDATDVC